MEPRPASRARATRRAAPFAGVCCLLVAVLAFAAPAGAAPSAVAQLVGKQHAIEQRVAAQQQQIIDAQASLDALQQRWVDARQAYADHLVAVYERGEPAAASLLASRGIGEAIARAQVVTQVGDYERSLLRAIEQADANAESVRQQRDALAVQVQLSYAQLDDVRGAIVAAQDAAHRRAAKRAAAAKAASAAAPAAFTQLASFAQPAAAAAPTGLGALTSFGQGMFTSSADAASIDSYLQGKGSPMAGNGSAFVLSAQRWGLDPRLVVAIAGAESNFGLTTCASFNAWGWGCPSGPVQFGSWADGIEAVASGLRRNYLDQGRLSVPAINAKYAPLGAANDPLSLNSNWTTNVSRFLVEQGGNPQYVGASGQQAPASIGATSPAITYVNSGS